ncbi:MAG TPA: hypothetical protein VF510_06835 [Ktedonobacterales bacterium]
MPDQLPDPFSAGGVFAANPNLYDYLHTLQFNSTGTLEMLDGAGQVLNTLVRGRFNVEQLTSSAFQLNFHDLIELNPYYELKRRCELDPDVIAESPEGYIPYDEDDILCRLDPFSVHVVREEGLFVLRQQVIWRIKDEQEWPYLLYRSRYRFASDPLATHESNRRGNLYYMLEKPQPDTRVYYRAADAQDLTARDLALAGITIEKEQS